MLKDSCLFEISWEVCNKVGGIHTVLESKTKSVLTAKLAQTSKHLNHYYVVGPYLGDDNSEFIPCETPSEFKAICDDLSSKGITLHFGEWDVVTKPKAILVEYLGYSEHTNAIKGEIWDKFKIDSLNSDWYDFDQVLLWSWCCGVAIDALKEVLCKEVVVHAHEWISGGSILYLKSIESPCKTVFTTHATMMGRALAGSGDDLYALEKQEVDWEKKAYSLGIYTKHQTEKTLARISDCFTTVSNITNTEARLFYGKEADVLLYNGFNNEFFTLDGCTTSKEHMCSFLEGYFHDFGGIDKENLSVLFTSGRYEIRNKGIDVFVESLSQLNESLKEKQSNVQVVALFLVILGEFPENTPVRTSLDNYASGKERKNGEFAPLSTHEVDTQNEIVNLFLQHGLYNRKDDNVKVIFVPSLLNGKDQFFKRDYYDITKGLDLGVFASFYEPWGYTPLESLSFGVPSVTTDLSGFGRYVKENNLDNSGLSILPREGKTHERVVEELRDELCRFTNKSSQEKLNQKSDARELALKCDWSEFYKNYIRAYEIAISKQ